MGLHHRFGTTVPAQGHQIGAAWAGKAHRVAGLLAAHGHDHLMLGQHLSHALDGTGLDQRQVTRQDQPAIGIWRGGDAGGDAGAHALQGMVGGVCRGHHMPGQAGLTHGLQHPFQHRHVAQQGLQLAGRATQGAKPAAAAGGQHDHRGDHGANRCRTHWPSCQR